MRRGRPPAISNDGSTYVTKVRGKQFMFRAGGDGRLRALGNPERDQDFDYAREHVAKHVVKEGLS